MLYCPLCLENYVVVSTLCEDCKKIKHCISLYSRNKVIEVLNATLIRSNAQILNKCIIYDKDKEDYVKKEGKWVKKGS